MSVNSVASQSVFHNSTTSVNKRTDTASDTAVTSADAMIVSAANSTNAAISTKWGFKVDENGFFGSDFNKAAGIPANVKIHQITMQQAEAFEQASGTGADPLTIVSKVWSLYKTVTGSTLDPDGTGYMSPKQVDAMPQSYTSKGNVLEGIVAVQYTVAESVKASPHSESMSNPGFRSMAQYGTGTDEEIVKRGRDLYDSYTGNENDGSLPKDKLSIGELFGNFFSNSVGNETQQYLDPNHEYAAPVKDTQIYWQTLTNGQGYAQYIINAFGQNTLDEIINYMGIDHDAPLAERKFSQELADKFITEMNKEMKAQYALYQANKYSSLDTSISESNDIDVSSPLSQGYQTAKNIKLPTTGTLINIGA